MSSFCPECGAPTPDQGSCRDNFHSLLALEWQVPGAAGTLAHFFAVSSYILQHPDSMDFTVESLADLRTSVGDALKGIATVNELRRRARRHGEASDHVTRREGERVPSWRIEEWSTSIADVLAGGVDGYEQRVQEWASSVLLDTEGVRLEWCE